MYMRTSTCTFRTGLPFPFAMPWPDLTLLCCAASTRTDYIGPAQSKSSCVLYKCPKDIFTPRLPLSKKASVLALASILTLDRSALDINLGSLLLTGLYISHCPPPPPPPLDQAPILYVHIIPDLGHYYKATIPTDLHIYITFRRSLLSRPSKC
jgi:hypothetical protein